MAELKAVAHHDIEFRQQMADLLFELGEALQAGQLDGLYVIAREKVGERGEYLITHRRAAISDGNVSWGAVEALLAMHRVMREP